MRARILTSMFLLLSLNSMAQELYGLVHSNYAGLDAATLNPARLAGQWLYADIRFVGADLYAWNSVAAYGDRGQRLISELRGGMKVESSGIAVQRAARPNNRAFAIADAVGPGAAVAVGRATISAGVRLRAGLSAVGASSELSNFVYHGLGYSPQHGQRMEEGPMRAVGMAWSEFSLGYAHIIHARGFSLFSAGANMKYGVAHAGAGLRIDEASYTVVDTTRVEVHSIKADYGYALPALRAGSGFGADIGFVYERTMSEADGYMPHRSSGGCDPMRYRYRIGASLIDLGGLRFSQATTGALEGGALSIADYNTATINGIEGADSLLASSTRWHRGNGMSIGLPSAAALQFDLRAAERAFVAFGLVQQVSGDHGMRLRRPNSMALAPRIETRHFEAALPIVVREYEFMHPAIGLMLRFDGFVIGTDNLLPFISKRDIHSLDAYFRLRWMIARSPFCKGKRKAKGSHRSGSKEMMPCAAPIG
ncbi:MAG: hypothetical protein IPJ85_09345 [Flavobacteriales bacterium]|nr:hypothetical protein [Flavobacteriales bacterium]